MSVVELRQYTLNPGTRDTLIDLFDREFIESQEAVGIRVVGQFRDLDDPDRFVWVRSFQDMESRRASLTAFYLEGSAWRTHGPAASATMVDSTNALLLRPVRPGSDFPPSTTPRPPVGTGDAPPSRVVATIYDLDAPVDAEFARFFEQQVAPVMAETGAAALACLRTEHAENTFPRLPVRDGEQVFVWFSSFSSSDRHRDHLERLAQSRTWNEKVLPELLGRLRSAPQCLVLAPTARSQLR